MPAGATAVRRKCSCKCDCKLLAAWATSTDAFYYLFFEYMFISEWAAPLVTCALQNIAGCENLNIFLTLSRRRAYDVVELRLEFSRVQIPYCCFMFLLNFAVICNLSANILIRTLTTTVHSCFSVAHCRQCYAESVRRVNWCKWCAFEHRVLRNRPASRCRQLAPPLKWHLPVRTYTSI